MGMSREQILELINKHRKSDDDVLSVSVLKEFVNTIYDDFESRVCENCKHYYDNGVCLEIEEDNSIATYDMFGLDFGCNKWESK